MFFTPGTVNLASRSLLPSIAQRPWSDYYLDYMKDRDIYQGQNAALFVDAWLTQLWSTINVVNIGKATAQGWGGLADGGLCNIRGRRNVRNCG